MKTATLDETIVRKNHGSRDRVCRVLWVCHVMSTVGCVFRDFYQVNYCDSVRFDELRGETGIGKYLTEPELVAHLEKLATVVTQDRDE